MERKNFYYIDGMVCRIFYDDDQISGFEMETEVTLLKNYKSTTQWILISGFIDISEQLDQELLLNFLKDFEKTTAEKREKAYVKEIINSIIHSKYSNSVRGSDELIGSDPAP